MLLSKKQYPSWREIQSDFTDYKASLGPWSESEAFEYLRDEYPALEPAPDVQIAQLLKSSMHTKELTFRD